MDIRTYTCDDREQVVAIWNEIFPDSIGHNEPVGAIDRKLSVGDDLFFVAAEGETIVGTIMAGYDGHRGWLYSVAVDNTFRRRGIGSQLVRHAESALAKLGCPKINLQVRAGNASVTAFYESLGFQAEERISMGKLVGD